MGFQTSSKCVAYRHDPPLKEAYPPSLFDRKSILEVCIDLYQLHWPDRYVAVFAAQQYHGCQERDSISIRESLLALKELLDKGKIRTYGLSNETTFGVCEYVRIADEIGIVRPATIQNSFCLLDRAFESHLAEACAPSNFNIGVLPFLILAGDTLTGKYLDKVDLEGNALDESLKNTRHIKYK